jgi:hypothetical protein
MSKHVAKSVRLHREPTGSWLTFPLSQPIPVKVKVTGPGECEAENPDQKAFDTIEAMVENEFPGWQIVGLGIAQDGGESPDEEHE